MPGDFDLERLAEIPDPFAGQVGAPLVGAGPRGVVSSTRSRIKTTRAVAAVAAIAYEAAWLGLAGLRPSMSAVGFASAVAGGFLVALAALALAWSGVARRGQRARSIFWPPATWVVVPPLLFALWALSVSPEVASGGPFWGGALHCMVQTMILTVGPLAFGVWAYRHAFATASGWRTAALGVACGALSAATICLSCPDPTALHIIVGHGTAMIIGGVVGAFLGYRLTRA